jgi:hypothetical protein
VPSISTDSSQPRNLDHGPEGKGWLVLVVVLLAFTASCWHTFWAITTPSGQHQQAAVIRKGMSPEQVRALQGLPESIEVDGHGGGWWTYSIPTGGTFVVLFSPFGRVVDFSSEPTGQKVQP